VGADPGDAATNPRERTPRGASRRIRRSATPRARPRAARRGRRGRVHGGRAHGRQARRAPGVGAAAHGGKLPPGRAAAWAWVLSCPDRLPHAWTATPSERERPCRRIGDRAGRGQEARHPRFGATDPHLSARASAPPDNCPVRPPMGGSCSQSSGTAVRHDEQRRRPDHWLRAYGRGPLPCGCRVCPAGGGRRGGCGSVEPVRGRVGGGPRPHGGLAIRRACSAARSAHQRRASAHRGW